MTTSLSSSLLRHHPHEQTPLLEANAVADEASLIKASSSPYQQQERSEERAHNDLKPPQHDVVRDQGEEPELTREDENTASSKTSIGIVGVISVLLLGS